MLNSIIALSFILLSFSSFVKLIDLSQRRHLALTCSFIQITRLLSRPLNTSTYTWSPHCRTKRKETQFVTRSQKLPGTLEGQFQKNLVHQSLTTAKDHSP